MALADNTYLLGFGLLGQLLFSARFFVQWLASERAGRSVIPRSFWYLSVAGGAVLFVYACVRRDPVFMIGQGSGLLIYARNLFLVLREANARPEADRARNAERVPALEQTHGAVSAVDRVTPTWG